MSTSISCISVDTSMRLRTLFSPAKGLSRDAVRLAEGYGFLPAAHVLLKSMSIKYYMAANRRELAGGWRLIVMEYLHPDDGWLPVTHSEWDAALHGAMEHAVEDHFCSACQRSPSSVHGDLRPTNVFVRK